LKLGGLLAGELGAGETLVEMEPPAASAAQAPS